MNGYELTRSWFDYCFEHEECKTQHTALFMWIVELNNRLGWKENFGLPTGATMEGLSIGNKNTYISALKDLQKWGFIKIVKEAKNQYQSCIVTICCHESDTALVSALDTALIRHDTQHCTSIDVGTGTSTVPIDKPINNETNKPLNQNKKPLKFDPKKMDLPFNGQFKETWSEWVDYRIETKKTLTPTSAKKQLQFVSCYSEETAIAILLQSITNGWQGLFELKNKSSAPPGPGKIVESAIAIRQASQNLLDKGLIRTYDQYLKDEENFSI